MDAAFLRKAFALITKGLIEKEQLSQKESSHYPYSKTLQHGINMFLAASYQVGKIQNVTIYSDEASFLSHFIIKPICEWFGDWDTRWNFRNSPFMIMNHLLIREAQTHTHPLRPAMNISRSKTMTFWMEQTNVFSTKN